MFNAGTATLTNSTVSGNTAAGNGGYGSGHGYGYGSGSGGGISGSGFTVGNTIIAGNVTFITGNVPADAPDVAGSVTSPGNNLIGITDGSTGWTDADLTGTSADPLDPGLGGLADNGGPTQTMALLPGSPAIDAGTATGARAPTSAASGDVGAVDIGAFESSGFTIAVLSGSGQANPDNTAFSAPLVVQVTSNNLLNPEPVAGGQVTFTAPPSGASATLSESPASINADGTASVTATANGTGGSYTVLATARGITTPASFSLTNIWRRPSALSSRRPSSTERPRPS